ncbi:hypothetical protein GUITHDRAFT_152814 [Guillardia theta CCMP2712]|uniref:Uncharacterized protein n=1 Tax=Guillardia theta (strain CCMP2712) TaxID=905079 RepID=L1J8W0_GUITC|nr:hypothetical protein GUITHDRAFT_152814 [Guillardia theta CCMP2712]EKX44988.1 hypothetical protein GUITHDRAFT_152814 [Guillardia theta CCMP2712]|mmetsp:Transcript_8365/g.28102  ORF Transcript_8365/g.28102 Transcript_8365/m.28102 type:complete len:88 (+) Transcript_8365:314-577(+)|eukprot:XP_005831968.1 hypothetical protein GUITHDRAFT_152814 [Guillardia theta CCMP2712]
MAHKLSLDQDGNRSRDILLADIETWKCRDSSERRVPDIGLCEQNIKSVSDSNEKKAKNYETIWKKHIEIRKSELESNEELQKWLNLW